MVRKAFFENCANALIYFIKRYIINLYIYIKQKGSIIKASGLLIEILISYIIIVIIKISKKDVTLFNVA